MDFDEAKRATGDEAMAIMEALDQPEVQEAIEAWANTIFNVMRALERAGVPRGSIIGLLGGTIFSYLQAMDE